MRRNKHIRVQETMLYQTWVALAKTTELFFSFTIAIKKKTQTFPKYRYVQSEYVFLSRVLCFDFAHIALIYDRALRSDFFQSKLIFRPDGPSPRKEVI